MSSITLALSTRDKPVPGIYAAAARDLFIMHSPAARNWIATTMAASRDTSGVMIVADDKWANPGGYESLTIPASQADLDALVTIRARAAQATENAAGAGQ